MGISSIGGGGTTLWSFQQLNRKVNSEGVQTASEISRKAGDYSRVSNFGTETKLGTSKFQQGNRETDSIGESKTSEFMQKAKSYFEVSNFGTETNLGKSRFQQTNANVSSKFDSVASAYKQAASLGSTNLKGALVDIGA
jgi:hypothetical protein